MKLDIKGYRGLDRTVTLHGDNLISGAIGTGKSGILNALSIALLGYDPELSAPGKKARPIDHLLFCDGEEMSVKLQIGDDTVTRGYARTTPVNRFSWLGGDDVDEWAQYACKAFPAFFDFDEFASLSDAGQLKFLSQLVNEEKGIDWQKARATELAEDFADDLHKMIARDYTETVAKWEAWIAKYIRAPRAVADEAKKTLATLADREAELAAPGSILELQERETSIAARMTSIASELALHVDRREKSEKIKTSITIAQDGLDTNDDIKAIEGAISEAKKSLDEHKTTREATSKAIGEYETKEKATTAQIAELDIHIAREEERAERRKAVDDKIARADATFKGFAPREELEANVIVSANTVKATTANLDAWKRPEVETHPGVTLDRIMQKRELKDEREGEQGRLVVAKSDAETKAKKLKELRDESDGKEYDDDLLCKLEGGTCPALLVDCDRGKEALAILDGIARSGWYYDAKKASEDAAMLVAGIVREIASIEARLETMSVDDSDNEIAKQNELLEKLEQFDATRDELVKAAQVAEKAHEQATDEIERREAALLILESLKAERAELVDRVPGVSLSEHVTKERADAVELLADMTRLKAERVAEGEAIDEEIVKLTETIAEATEALASRQAIERDIATLKSTLATVMAAQSGESSDEELIAERDGITEELATIKADIETIRRVAIAHEESQGMVSRLQGNVDEYKRWVDVQKAIRAEQRAVVAASLKRPMEIIANIADVIDADIEMAVEDGQLVYGIWSGDNLVPYRACSRGQKNLVSFAMRAMFMTIVDPLYKVLTMDDAENIGKEALASLFTGHLAKDLEVDAVVIATNDTISPTGMLRSRMNVVTI